MPHSGLWWTREHDGAHVPGAPVVGFAAARGPQVVPLRATFVPSGDGDVDAVAGPRYLDVEDGDVGYDYRASPSSRNRRSNSGAMRRHSPGGHW